MAEHCNNQSPCSESAERSQVSARTELLRLAADGELTPYQEVELERHLAAHPGDLRVIEFERKLRRSVADIFSEAAPAVLRERIVAKSHTTRTPRGSLSIYPVSTRLNFRFSTPLRWLAVAASVAIVAGGTYLALRPPGVGPTQPVAISQQYRIALVSFIGSQHHECELYADMIGVRFKTTQLVDVPREFSRVLGSAPDIGHIEEHGFRLLGAGPCAVPGRGKSVRMVLESTADAQSNGGGGSLVSIHIQQDTGELNLEAGKTYRLVDKVGSAGVKSPDIFVWRRDGFIYFLTSESKAAMQMALASFGTKEPSGTI